MNDLPRALGAPPLTGLLRVRPEDFVVEELPLLEPEGAGGHLWLLVRKRDANTRFVARLLARLAGVPPREVGYAGLKDRHAVTTQWFSLPDPRGRLSLSPGALAEGVTLLEARHHPRKLRRGMLAGNRFHLLLRDWQGDPEAAQARLALTAAQGVPNYFGEQRFGREGGNVDRALAMFRGEYRPRDRGERGILLSAARSALFNAVLAERVRQGNWNRILPGEAVLLDGSASFFLAEDEVTAAEAEARRVAGDCHPSGPLWGRGRPPSRGLPATIEQGVAEARAALADGLEHAGLRQERRSLRLLPRAVGLEVCDAGLRISFELPPGGYATVLLRELADYRLP